jgi:hypothetical protein
VIEILLRDKVHCRDVTRVEATSNGLKVMKYTFKWPWNDVRIRAVKYSMQNIEGCKTLVLADNGDIHVNEWYYGLNMISLCDDEQLDVFGL